MEEEDDFTDRYGYNSGTSMASPMVAGAVAFAALNFPDDTVQERKNRILNAVIPLASLSDKVLTGGTLNLRNIVDSDSDNLPDWWEFERFSTLVNTPSQDSDSDGYTNQEEYLAQTDPIDASSILSDSDYSKISDFSMTENGELEFTFIAYPGYRYTLETLNSLGDTWLNALSPIDGDGNEQKITVDQLDAQESQFYRIKIEPIKLGILHSEKSKSVLAIEPILKQSKGKAQNTSRKCQSRRLKVEQNPLNRIEKEVLKSDRDMKQNPK